MFCMAMVGRNKLYLWFPHPVFGDAIGPCPLDSCSRLSGEYIVTAFNVGYTEYRCTSKDG